MRVSELSVEAKELRERSAEIGVLRATLAEVAGDGHGRLVLVHGEAGIGKTALVRSFCAAAPGSTGLLWGRCENLFTPRPLGALVDIASAAGTRLADTLRREATPFDVATALAAEMVAQRPAVLVLEDVHLADEATLDVLRILCARVTDVAALIIVTYRDDELGRWHPLRIVLGEISATSRVQRLKLTRLSSEAVVSMAAAEMRPGEELYRMTAGNPFFVAEVLAGGGEQIPETVRDAVLGRAAQLSTGARRLLDAIAVAHPNGELWLLEALASDDIAALDETIASGIVSAREGAVSFRHELARRAVEEAIPLHRSRALHRGALELLASPRQGELDPARLAHHAEAVGDGDLVLRFAPVAAQNASKLGAHRQAASHFGAALRFADRMSVNTRAEVFAGAAYELFLIDDFEGAAEAQRQAVRWNDDLADRRREGATLTFLAQLLWMVGSLPDGLKAVEASLALLGDRPTPELVGACCQMSALQLAAEDVSAAMAWARRAQQLADEVDHPPSRVNAMQAIGWVEFVSGDSAGIDKLVEALETAKAAGWEAMAAVAYVIIVRTACRRREYAIAEPFIRAGLDYCITRDYDVWRYYLLSWDAKVSLARGDWTRAGQAALICLGEPCPFARIHALVALGLLRARRGDPDVWGPLDEALTLALPRHELQWLAPVAIARAEAAWLEGRSQDAIAETDVAIDDATGTWWSAGLAYWRWRAGADGGVPDEGEQQLRLEMAGEWAGASEAWSSIGCPYEAAFALLDADEDGLRRALGELRAMGANPAAKAVEARLRESGARDVPRGPRPRTRDNPAGLTAREAEVLELVSEGLRNAEIAARLYLSERTVDHHVSAILRKLGAANRLQAVTEATRLGMRFPT